MLVVEAAGVGFCISLYQPLNLQNTTKLERTKRRGERRLMGIVRTLKKLKKGRERKWWI